jgi:hypothetical protein
MFYAALCLFPPAFRREFGDEMRWDFDEARSAIDRVVPPLNPRAHRLARWRLYSTLAADLARTVPLQWARSGLPLIVVLSAIVPFAAVYAIARVMRQMVVVMPVPEADADVIGVVLLVSITISLVAMTIVFTLWFVHPLLSKRRRV